MRNRNSILIIASGLILVLVSFCLIRHYGCALRNKVDDQNIKKHLTNQIDFSSIELAESGNFNLIYISSNDTAEEMQEKIDKAPRYNLILVFENGFYDWTADKNCVLKNLFNLKITTKKQNKGEKL